MAWRISALTHAHSPIPRLFRGLRRCNPKNIRWISFFWVYKKVMALANLTRTTNHPSELSPKITLISQAFRLAGPVNLALSFKPTSRKPYHNILSIMLHVHFHFCKFDTIFCCFGSGEALSSKPPPLGPNTLTQTQPPKQGAMQLSVIQDSTAAGSTTTTAT